MFPKYGNGPGSPGPAANDPTGRTSKRHAPVAEFRPTTRRTRPLDSSGRARETLEGRGDPPPVGTAGRGRALFRELLVPPSPTGYLNLPSSERTRAMSDGPWNNERRRRGGAGVSVEGKTSRDSSNQLFLGEDGICGLLGCFVSAGLGEVVGFAAGLGGVVPFMGCCCGFFSFMDRSRRRTSRESAGEDAEPCPRHPLPGQASGTLPNPRPAAPLRASGIPARHDALCPWPVVA